MKTVLHLCADIGSDSYPYKCAGYKVIKVGKNVGVENFHAEGEVYGVFANPVCTDFSIARGFHKPGDLDRGMFLVNECLRIIRECQEPFGRGLKFWVLENPASGRLKEKLGPPTFVYEPWMFGSPWTKKTALWGRFNIPKIKYSKWEEVPRIPELYQRPGRGKPSLAFMHKSAKAFIREFDPFNVEDDMSFRSLCSQGFAKAFFEANP